MTTANYTVTNAAGPMVAGFRVRHGDTIALTADQAEYELRVGTIVLAGVTPPAGATAASVLGTDVFALKRLGVERDVAAADLFARLAAVAPPETLARLLGSSSTRRVIALSSSFPPVYGSDGSEKLACSFIIPAGTVAPDSVLEIAGLVSFSTPSYVDKAVIFRLGGQPVAQAFAKSGVGGITFETKLFVAADRKSAATFSQNINGILQPDVAAVAPFTNSGVGGVAIDFTVDQLFEGLLYPNNGDTAQIMGLSVVNEFTAPVPTRSLAAKPLAFWGDSWIASAGSANGGVPGRILRTNPGSQVVNLGIGGETAQQIADRFCADAVYGRLVPVVIECGLNNISTPGPGTAGNVVMASIARMVASLAPGVPYLVCNVPQTVWPTASGNGQWITAHNAGLLARYGQRVVNWRDAISTNPDGTMPDSVKHDPVADAAHPNDAGYDLITAATQAKLAQFAMV